MAPSENLMATPHPETRILPTEEEFAIWCDHPVTQWVAAAHKDMADRNRVAWIEVSWTSDATVDPDQLLILREQHFCRADAYMALLQSDYLDYLNINNLEEWKKWNVAHNPRVKPAKSSTSARSPT